MVRAVLVPVVMSIDPGVPVLPVPRAAAAVPVVSLGTGALVVPRASLEETGGPVAAAAAALHPALCPVLAGMGSMAQGGLLVDRKPRPPLPLPLNEAPQILLMR